MERVPTGIKGFDNLIQGGLPKNSATLLLGSYGTGKSIFSLEYIYNGALKNQSGLYICFEENEEELVNQAKMCGYNEIDNLIKKKLINFLCIPANEISKTTMKTITTSIKKLQAQRIIIDSVSALSINAPVYSIAQSLIYKETRGSNNIIPAVLNPDDLKKNFIFGLIRELKNLKTTSILISEERNGVSTEQVTEYVADGVIHLTFESLGSEVTRNLIVKKMRMTSNNFNSIPFKISNTGIKILK